MRYRLNKRGKAVVYAIAITAALAICTIDVSSGNEAKATVYFEIDDTPVSEQVTKVVQTTVEYVETTTEPTKRYELTLEERDLIERVVTAEARNQPIDGMALVAQCILNTAEIDGYSIERVINSYGYAKPADKATEKAIQAVSAVFDDGYEVTDEPIIYFYNPAMVESKFHESQVFVIELGDHRFFKRK